MECLHVNPNNNLSMSEIAVGSSHLLILYLKENEKLKKKKPNYPTTYHRPSIKVPKNKSCESLSSGQSYESDICISYFSNQLPNSHCIREKGGNRNEINNSKYCQTSFISTPCPKASQNAENPLTKQDEQSSVTSQSEENIATEEKKLSKTHQKEENVIRPKKEDENKKNGNWDKELHSCLCVADLNNVKNRFKYNDKELDKLSKNANTQKTNNSNKSNINNFSNCCSCEENLTYSKKKTKHDKQSSVTTQSEENITTEEKKLSKTNQKEENVIRPKKDDENEKNGNWDKELHSCLCVADLINVKNKFKYDDKELDKLSENANTQKTNNTNKSHISNCCSCENNLTNSKKKINNSSKPSMNNNTSNKSTTSKQKEPFVCYECSEKFRIRSMKTNTHSRCNFREMATDKYLTTEESLYDCTEILQNCQNICANDSENNMSHNKSCGNVSCYRKLSQCTNSTNFKSQHDNSNNQMKQTRHSLSYCCCSLDTASLKPADQIMQIGEHKTSISDKNIQKINELELKKENINECISCCFCKCKECRLIAVNYKKNKKKEKKDKKEEKKKKEKEEKKEKKEKKIKEKKEKKQKEKCAEVNKKYLKVDENWSDSDCSSELVLKIPKKIK